MRRLSRPLVCEGAESRRPAVGRGAKRLATFALTLAVLAGCGVAQETGVVQDEKVAQKGVRGRNSEQRFPPKRDATIDEKQFVLNYLQAAAGDDTTKAAERLRDFLLPEVASSWQPTKPDIQVVRQVGDPTLQPLGGGANNVTVRLQPVGRLTDQGTVEAPKSWAEISPTFEVRGAVAAEPDQKAPKKLFLAKAPTAIYLLDTALTNLYVPYSIYFWDNENRTLVPDQRYLPATVAEQGRPTVVVRWLLGGPSTLVKQAATGLPSDASLLGVYTENGALVVNLSARAIAPDGGATDRLMAQLRWSLWDLYSGPIRLLIGGQPKALDASPDKYRQLNRAAALPAVPDWFCVVGGQIRAGCQTVPPVLNVAENAGVVSAAVSTDSQTTRVAMVKGTPGKRTLSILQIRNDGSKPAYSKDILTARTMSRPVWFTLTNPASTQALVAADGQLYRITLDGGVRSEPPLQVGSGPVTAVAVAPDARRIALVTAGRLWIAPLTVLGSAVAVGDGGPLFTPMASLSAVAFSAQGKVLVAGREGNLGWLVELSTDGGVQYRKLNLGLATVTQLAAYPEDPASPGTRGDTMVEANGRSFTVFANSLPEIVPPLPSPSPSTPPAVGAAVRATAPFYVD